MNKFFLFLLPIAFLIGGCNSSYSVDSEKQSHSRYPPPADAKNIQKLGNDWMKFTFTTNGKDREFLYHPGNLYGGKILVELD